MNDLQSNWTEQVSASSNSADAAVGHAAVGHTAVGHPAASAAPVSTPAAPANAAVANAVPVKQIVTIRLDVDTLNWFKSGGPGYQTRINQLLRDHMEAQLAQERNAA